MRVRQLEGKSLPKAVMQDRLALVELKLQFIGFEVHYFKQLSHRTFYFKRYRKNIADTELVIAILQW